MVSLCKKLPTIFSRIGRRSRGCTRLPTCPSARHIGHATLISGLVGGSPLRAVSPLSTFLENTPDDTVGFGQAKSALQVLSALGNMSVVPWLKGTALLGLEVVDLLDVSNREYSKVVLWQYKLVSSEFVRYSTTIFTITGQIC